MVRDISFFSEQKFFRAQVEVIDQFLDLFGVRLKALICASNVGQDVVQFVVSTIEFSEKLLRSYLKIEI